MKLNQAIFNFTAPNFMINKTFLVKELPEAVHVNVSSPFLGNWDFELDSMTYPQVCFALSKYCKGDLIQDCFPNILPDLRENFITPPNLWKTI